MTSNSRWIPDYSIAEDGIVFYDLKKIDRYEYFDRSWNDDFTIEAVQFNGSALPSWLTFDSKSLTFKGNPPRDWSGDLLLNVNVKNKHGNIVPGLSESFTLKVGAVNDAPTLAKGISDQAATEGALWSFTVPTDTFTDVDGPALSYSATLSDGSVLPSWLAFDATTRTFTGTPPQDAPSSLEIKVIASDGSLSISDTFNVAFAPDSDTTAPGDTTVPVGLYDDTLDGGDGSDWLHGGLGNDKIHGGGGNDTIYGGRDDGAILRYAVTASDPLSGKLAKVVIGDNLYGDDGTDTYHYASGDGVDLIWDFRAGEDVINVSGFAPDDVKVTFVREVTNRIDAGKYAKLMLIFGNDAGAIVFNDFPIRNLDDVILKFAGNKSLTWEQLLTRATNDGSAALSSPAAERLAPTEPDSPNGTATPVEISGVNENDILTGGEGADRLYGNDGYNWLDGHGGHDLLIGGNGKDVLLGGEGKDRLYGNEGDNWLEGNNGSDELYGGNVRDVMLGATGNDIAYGNGGDDWIIGGTGSDKLYGTGGADIIFGDDYVAGLLNGEPPVRPDKPQIDQNQPSPWVISEGRFLFTKTSMTLAADVQNVTAQGTASIKITGNSLNNTIIGNSGKNTVKAGTGDDQVDGGYGNDSLTGGTGDDTFIFSSKLGSDKTDRKVNFDKITDFSAGDDTIKLENKIFKKLGKAGNLKSSFFTVGSEAKDKNDYLVYNKATGVLSYDADGSGSKAAVEFAQLKKGLVLKYSDLDVI